jgi:hyaluronan synthase
VILSMAYREPKDRGVYKSVSLIIAVKNEESNIEQTIRQCLESNYPSHLMEVMVIDDGSTDRTWEVLTGLQPRYPQLQLFRFDENRGKRHAMALGAEKAKGEILIYLDSDSMVDPEGIYRIVQPFAEESVGAVAGHTMVIVEPDNFISKMECVRYFVSQRVMKAAESLFGAVTCCPGPFSAYRREAVLDVLQPWLHQTFFGTAATFGDDRSLTNFILRRYRVVYHAGARCSTFAPDRWRTLARQQLRWKKSWVRETTIAARRMYKEHPIVVLSYYFSIVITLVSPLIVLRAFFYSPLILQSHAYFPYIAGLLLVFLFLGLVHYYHTQSPYWYYGTVFAVLYCCFFCLQNYYAILTVRQNHWGTR